MLARPGTVLLVACRTDSQEVAGFLVYRLQQLVVYLAYLAVAPSYRRRRVAHRLVQVDRTTVIKYTKPAYAATQHYSCT